MTVTQAIEISGKKLTLDGGGHRMDRGTGYSNEFIALRNSADLTVKNITLDGGAKWAGAVDDILKRGTTNSGMKAGRPLILTRTQAQLTLGSGAVLQNNDNQANSQKVDTYLPVGGAIQISDGILSLNGGEIKDCNSAFFGGAAHIRGASTFTAKAGTVSGNNAGGYAAICLDNTARSIVEGGEFRNNKSGNNGGVFWLSMGTLSIMGGTLENNSTAGKGGVAYQDTASASVSLKGGVFRNNRAKGDGGVLYTPNGLSISGGIYEGNTSGGNGGAVWTNGTLSISGGSFRGNTAQTGTAIYQEGGKEVTITGFEEMQEIYLKTLGTITVQNELKGKRLPLQTESAVTDGMTVATLMVARPQEYGAVTTLNGSTVLPVKDEKAGWILKVDQTAQVCTVTYHMDGGSIQNQSNYESYRVGVGLMLPIPTKEGFLFRGWYPTPDFSGEAVTEIGTDAAGNKTFYAKWEKDEPLVNAAKPAAITLADASYTVGDNATALDGTTTAADGGKITYQWYEATSKDDQSGTLLEGKTDPTFTPDTTAAGTRFYYVVATNTNAGATGEKTAETRSNTVQITVQEPAPVKSFTVRYEWNGEAPSDANLPQDDYTYDTEEQARAAMDKTYTGSSTSTAQKDGKDGTWTFSGWTATVENTVVKFTGEWTFAETLKVDAVAPAPITLTDASYTVGDTAVTLDGTTTADDGGEITYQWYEATSKDDQNGTSISGETGPAFTPNTAAAGTRFYYVVATNTNAGATGEKTAETRSNTVQITVQEPAPVKSFTVRYEWNGEAPSDANLPQDDHTYDTEEQARAAMDTTYAVGSTSTAQKDGKAGTWTFSGWSATVEGTVVKFSGKWAFTETLKVDAVAPAPITLTDASCTVGNNATALDGTTTADDGGKITYQWYEATSKDDQNGTLLEGKTDPTFTPDTAVAGTRFYYVVATNTNASATGEKTAETRSNTVAITVTEKAVTYTVSYDWGTEFPDGETLPADSGAYQSVQDAEAAMDKTYTASSISTAQKDGKNGTWTFSGWTATVENTVVKFSGKWIFTETPVRPGRPSSGGSSDRDQNHSVSAPSHINGGAVSVTPAAAPKGTTVTITAKPDNGYKLDKLTVTDQSGNRLSLSDNGNGKYTFTMPDGKVTVDASFSKIAAAVSFRDVKQSDYYYDAVKWAVEQGITEGTSVDTFSPHASCTRAQTVTFLWRAAGSPEPTGTVNPFSDLSPNAYYYKAVLWAVENGITQGTSTDTFSPDATVTRGQTVTFLHRAAGAPSHGGNAAFLDINDNDYYSDAVAWAEQNGITSGTGNGKFSPNADCTRGQIVTLLYRADN